MGCTATGLIVAGFANGPQTRFLWPALVAGVAWVATYFALFTQKKQWHGLARRDLSRTARPLQTHAANPAAVARKLAAGLVVYPALHRAGKVGNTRLATLIHQGSNQILWMLVLRALRDAGIYLFFAWRNTQRKPLGMALLTYVMLGGVLLLFFTGAHKRWASLFEPMTGAGIEAFINHVEQGATFFTPLSWLAMAAHLLIVGALLVWRWKQSVQLPPEAPPAV
ncbi:MAG: hypothetical protein Q4A11_05490 [Brachymonas sp.]|nr:hypothetical protein [Brachymonas sp.]